MNRITAVVLVLLFVSFSDFAGSDAYAQGKPVGQQKAVSARLEPPVGQLADFFPTKPGTVLSYRIMLADKVNPIAYEEMNWLTSKDSILTAGRNLLSGTNMFGRTSDKIFFLTLMVKGSITPKKHFGPSAGVELSVEKDELGVYQDVQQIFWVPSTHGRFICQETVIYSADKTKPSNDIIGEGQSTRNLFFVDKPGTQIGRTDNFDNPHDKLLFNGVDLVPALYVNGLHFVRTVGAGFYGEDKTADNSSSFTKGFREDIYFVKGKGLVYLEQKVEGKTSMIWMMVDSPQ